MILKYEILSNGIGENRINEKLYMVLIYFCYGFFFWCMLCVILMYVMHGLVSCKRSVPLKYMVRIILEDGSYILVFGTHIFWLIGYTFLWYELRMF